MDQNLYIYRQRMVCELMFNYLTHSLSFDKIVIKDIKQAVDDMYRLVEKYDALLSKNDVSKVYTDVDFNQPDFISRILLKCNFKNGSDGEGRIENEDEILEGMPLPTQHETIYIEKDVSDGN